MKSIIKFITAIAVCELVGVLGAVFTTPSIPVWYAGLVKPTFNPASWLFAPVWTFLFLLMGIAAGIVWTAGPEIKKVKSALLIFGAQLVLNFLWSYIFFDMHSIGCALLEIIILWLAILATIISFHKISKPAAWLLVPYILWVTFAAVLNFQIWRLN